MYVSILVDESVDTNLMDAYSANGATNGPCSQHKKRMSVLKENVKRRLFNPTCGDNGFYAKKQCHSGYCWCSDRNGNLIAGSRRKGEVSCGMYTSERSTLQNTFIKKILHIVNSETSIINQLCHFHE